MIDVRQMLFEISKKGFFSVIQGITAMFQEENIKTVVQIIDWKFHNFIVIADTNTSFFDNRNIITEQ